ncbi:hypothetical protein CYMTET_55308 [Cymbomonas tetramitiformis]|uniref:Uncharacterized protein n=1 Tax=Cymbomonas tetramitiformis TaxID=36881 RepID=A0AAE0BDK2_9CHLO|nr:hypothetical protein CYMTET_55308 [Cymbomonas tetramitiformis]
MRSTVINENDDPAPQLTAVRTLGDKHARINPDYSEAKRVKDLWHILSTSAKHSPFVTPLYINVIRELRGGTPFSFSTLCLRLRTVWREEHAFATLATDTDPAAPPGGGGGGGGGGYRPKKPAFNAVTFDRTPAYSVKPVAQRKISSLLWGLTDGHPETKGNCPFTCREAFIAGRTPDSALPAGTRPSPQAFAAALAAIHQADGAAAHALVVSGEQPDPPLDASAMTFVAPLPDPPPRLDHPPLAEPHGGTAPAEDLHPAGMVQHPSDEDFTCELEPIAMLGFADTEDEEWPALRSKPWIPPTIGSSASHQPAADRT